MIYSLQATKKERGKIPILIRSIGINHSQEPVNRPHGLSFYQWFYCAKGTGEVTIDGIRNHISEGSGFLILPAISHSYRSITENWRVHFIGFEGPICHKMLSMLDMYRSGVYQFSNNKVFLDHVQSLFFIKDRPVKNKKLLYSKECYSFLLDISGQITPAKTGMPAQENGIVSSVISYLETNYYRDISLDELAQEMNRSKEYLCTVFKKSTGVTIIHHLRTIRIARARILLHQYPEKSIAEIAYECGFSNASYFDKKFKQIMGITPASYRAKHV